MNNVYILGGLRSHIGLKNGIFQTILPERLGAEVLKKVINKYNLVEIDQIICGNIVGTGGNITRLMALNAGVLNETPAFTIDMQCASGLVAIDLAYSKIKSGQCDLIVAGGFESTSMEPTREYNKKDYRYNPQNPSFSVAQFSPDEIGDEVMFKFAEAVASKENITKEELDFWTLESHSRANKARKDKILDMVIASTYGSFKDEGIRENISQKLLDRVPKVLKSGSLITAANSCLVNDAAAFVVLCSEDYLIKNKIKAQAKVIGTALTSIEPLYSPEAAIKAMDQLIKKSNLSYSDISAFEVNEAFAVIDVLFQRKNPKLIDRYNIFGGALAYGHPYGASGGVLMLHLLKSLEYVKGRYGITSIAAAGGIGVAILIERLKT